jgi:hypothetical protein
MLTCITLGDVQVRYPLSHHVPLFIKTQPPHPPETFALVQNQELKGL